MNSPRQHQAAFRVLPAQQRLARAHLAVVQVDARLVVQHKLLRPQAFAQGVVELQARQQVGVHFGPVKAVVAFAAPFDLVHGGVGVPDELIERVAVFGIERDP